MGVRLTGFHIHHQGMEREPYYIMREIDSVIYIKQTDCAPDDWCMLEVENSRHRDKSDVATYLGFADVLKDCEYGYMYKVTDRKPIEELESFIEEIGAKSWDGFNESVSLKGVLDAGDSYSLFLEFSDGSTVKVYGYNACPKGFCELKHKAQEVFQKIDDGNRENI